MTLNPDIHNEARRWLVASDMTLSAFVEDFLAQWLQFMKPLEPLLVAEDGRLDPVLVRQLFREFERSAFLEVGRANSHLLKLAEFNDATESEGMHK